MLGEQSAVEVLQSQLGHGHPLSGVVAHGKGSCSPSRHGHTILEDGRRKENMHISPVTYSAGVAKFYCVALPPLFSTHTAMFRIV